MGSTINKTAAQFLASHLLENAFTTGAPSSALSHADTASRRDSTTFGPKLFTQQEAAGSAAVVVGAAVATSRPIHLRSGGTTADYRHALAAAALPLACRFRNQATGTGLGYL